MVQVNYKQTSTRINLAVAEIDQNVQDLLIAKYAYLQNVLDTGISVDTVNCPVCVCVCVCVCDL